MSIDPATRNANTPVTAVNPKPPPRAVPKSVLEGGKLPEAVPVAIIVFEKMQKVMRNHSCEAIECKDTPQGRYSATFITRMQQFEIVWHPSDPKQPAERCFIGVDRAQYWTTPD